MAVAAEIGYLSDEQIQRKVVFSEELGQMKTRSVVVSDARHEFGLADSDAEAREQLKKRSFTLIPFTSREQENIKGAGNMHFVRLDGSKMDEEKELIMARCPGGPAHKSSAQTLGPLPLVSSGPRGLPLARWRICRGKWRDP
eukprot:Hpha_TRINITY_DN15601_c2_g2::TRINITY_DN15601_c2_g2_i5::g.101095::m.101095